MVQSKNSVSFDYLFARLHGMWANAVRGERRQKLIHSTTPAVLQENLRPYGLDAGNRIEFHRKLSQRRNSALTWIADLLGGASAKWYRSFLERAWYENLKLVLHAYFSDGIKEEIGKFLQSAKGVPSLDLKAFAEAKNEAALLDAVELLPDMQREQLAAVFQSLRKKDDFMVADAMLDRMYYHRLYQTAGGVSWSMRGIARRLVQQLIDINNLCALMRNARTYHFSPEQMSALWMPHGAWISEPQLTACVGRGELSEMFSSLPSAAQRALRMEPPGGVAEYELHLWQGLYHAAMAAFLDFNNPVGSVAAYPFLLHFENMNLSRIFEGIHFAIVPEEISKMMTGD